MTNRTRYFLIGSALILVVGLGVGLVAYYVGFPTVAFSAAGGPDDLQYIPPNASVVAYANVRDVMNSELRQRVKRFAGPGAENGQREFQEKTGINIETDIDRVVACLSPGDQSASPSQKGLIVARGRFDEVRIEAFTRDRGGKVEQYKGKRLLTHADPDPDSATEPGTPARARGDHEALALAFIEPGLVALGSGSAVRHAIDLKAGGQNITSNAELMKMVRDLDDGNAWAVGRFDVLAHTAKLPEGVASQIPPITWFAATSHVNGGVRGVLRAEARDETAAQNLRDVIRGFMALAKLQASSRPEMQMMLQSLELSGAGKTVALSFSVPAQVFDAVAPRPKREVQP
jgi:hypothetical protein